MTTDRAVRLALEALEELWERHNERVEAGKRSLLQADQRCLGAALIHLRAAAEQERNENVPASVPKPHNRRA